jgi:hypothetical protein
MKDKLDIECPHCGSKIQVDAESEVVVSHEPPVHLHDKVGFDERLQQLDRDKARAADRMEEAMRREKDKSRLMDDRFNELFM